MGEGGKASFEESVLPEGISSEEEGTTEVRAALSLPFATGVLR